MIPTIYHQIIITDSQIYNPIPIFVYVAVVYYHNFFIIQLSTTSIHSSSYVKTHSYSYSIISILSMDTLHFNSLSYLLSIHSLYFDHKKMKKYWLHKKY